MLAENQTFDPYALPPFANEVNRTLAQQIKEKEKKLNLVQFQYEDNVSRSTAMLNHIKSIRQEMGQTQALYEAKSRQLEAETNFKKLASRQSSRLVKEIQSIDQEIQTLNDQMNSLQTNMYKGTEKLDQFRSEMKISKGQLEELLKVQQEKEEDQQVIEKYSKEDEMKLKDLTMQIEKANSEVIRLKSNMDAEVTNAQVTQLELNQTTEQFRLTHRERENLLNQWTDILTKIQKKDEMIQSIEEQLIEIQDVVRVKKNLIQEKQEFLNQQELQVEEKSKEITLLETNLAKVKSQELQETQQLQEYQDQLYVMRNEVYKSSADLENKSSELKRLQDLYDDKVKSLQVSKDKLQETKLNLDKMMTDKSFLESKARELEKAIKMEENRNKSLEKELKATKDVLFKKTQELFKLKQDEKNMTSELASGQANIRMIRSKIHQLEQDMLKQKAIIYAQDFQIEQLDKKVRRAQGERSDEEREQLEATIKELTEKFDHQAKIAQLLTTQLKKSQDDLRIAKRREDALQKEKDQVIANMNEVTLYLDGIQKQVSQQTKHKGECMVEEGLLRLEVRKLREVLNSRADEVFSLESKTLQLNSALEERNKEISIQKDLLRLQLKQSEEERSSATAELRDRVKKVENLKKRYEILMSQFSHPDQDDDDDDDVDLGEDTEKGLHFGRGSTMKTKHGKGSSGKDHREHTQAYFIIKAAQKKEKLQKEGDELDRKIKKAEREILELENTLKFMVDHNDEYRAYLVKSELNSRDLQHKEMLEQQYTMVMEKYKTKRQDYQTLHSEVIQVESQLNQLNSRESNLMQAVAILEKKLHSLENDVTEQNEKRKRAWKSVYKLVKEIKQMNSTRRPSPSDEHAQSTGVETDRPDEDLNLRFLKDKVHLALTEIARIAEEHPDVAYTIYDLIKKYDMTIPSQPISRINSRPETVRDDSSSIKESSSFSSNASSIGRSGNNSKSGGGSNLDLRASYSKTRATISPRRVSLNHQSRSTTSLSQADSQTSSVISVERSQTGISGHSLTSSGRGHHQSHSNLSKPNDGNNSKLSIRSAGVSSTGKQTPNSNNSSKRGSQLDLTLSSKSIQKK